MICIRRLGDVLLSTALVRSLKRAWPDTQIDFLVNAGAAVTLQGNPDIARLIVQPEKTGVLDFLRIAARIFRRYDLAISTLYNDRPHFYALLGSAVRAGVISQNPAHSGNGWKARLTRYPVLLDSRNHTVVQYLRLADALGIPSVPEVVAPRPAATAPLADILGPDWHAAPYVVVHPRPMYGYKALPDDTWRGVIGHLLGRGLRVYLTGGPAEAERAQVAAIATGFDPAQVRDVAGRLRFAELTPLIEKSLAYVGPDTSVTHLAAAANAPTLVLFGPTDPMTWGPWPQGYAADKATPWITVAPLQHEKNVWILQGIKHCVPCYQEGCGRHRESRSDCLDEMPVSRITAVLDRMLEQRSGAQPA